MRIEILVREVREKKNIKFETLAKMAGISKRNIKQNRTTRRRAETVNYDFNSDCIKSRYNRIIQSTFLII